MGGRGASGMTREEKDLRAYNKLQNREREKIDALLNSGDVTKTLELEESSRILEKLSMNDMKNFVRMYLSDSDGYVLQDDSFAFLYKDGSVATYSSGDEIKKVNYSKIAAVIQENESTTMFSGKKIEVFDYNDTDRDKLRYGTPDWRVDFKYR